jgi:endogenous inhibitor of DNA gyrase (YacG/DUF329 family)
MGKTSIMINCICRKCGKDFLYPASQVNRGRGKYCSRECTGNARRRVQVKCQNCGKLFEKAEWAAKRSARHYCSTRCRNLCAIDFAHFPPPIKTRIERACEICGENFTEVPSRISKGYGKYCSKSCYGKSLERRVERQCGYCGNTFFLRNGLVRKTNCCSKECYSKWFSESHKGSKSTSWKGGRVAYRGPNWYSQRNLVRERDGQVCQICQKKHKVGERLFPIHHIIPFRNFNGDYEAANQLSNLITLCRSCHTKAEYGKIACPKRLF